MQSLLEDAWLEAPYTDSRFLVVPEIPGFVLFSSFHFLSITPK